MPKKSTITSILIEFLSRYPKHFLLLFILLLLDGLIAAGTILSVVPLTDYLIDPSLNNPNKVTVFAITTFNNFNIPPIFWSFVCGS